MKKYVLTTCLCFFLFLTIKGQNADTSNIPPSVPGVLDNADSSKVHTVVEVMPEYPGGEEALLQFLNENIRYPKKARNNSITGKVYASFIVNQDGKVTDLKIIRGIGGGCDEEVLRVLALMPDWKPGEQDGRKVLVQYNLPVTFNLLSRKEMKARSKSK